MEYAVEIILFITVIFFLIKKDDKDRLAEINKIFDGRDSLSPEQFHEKYYSKKGISEDIVVSIIKLLESELDTELSRLIPEDDFSANLRYLFEFDSMADVAIIESIESEYSIKISDVEAESLKTINDLVFFINNRVNCT